MTEYFETGIKKGRGMAQRSLDLIDAMHAAAEAAQPITGRGIGYKLFTAGLIPSMATNEMQRVYRLLKEAREQDIIPWEWIVDETRSTRAGIDLGRSRRIRPLCRAILSPRFLESAAASESKSGPRRAPCAACLPRCSISTPSASFQCTGSAAPLRLTILPRMTTVAI